MKSFYTICLSLLITIGFAQQSPNSPNQTQSTSVKAKGCVNGDCDNGWGKWVYDNGFYSGFWVNSKRHGYGLYDWNDAGKYIGFWKDDKREGYGIYFYNEGDEMSGEFLNGELTGLGKTYIDGKYKQGYYENGNLKTEYTFFTNNVETGCVAGDCQNKYGRYKWANGDVFTGFFRNGNMYMGSYKFANGDKYTGMFNNQNGFHGNGRFFFQNGEYYGGQWANGKYHGRGYYVTKDATSMKGVWTNGSLTEPFND